MPEEHICVGYFCQHGQSPSLTDTLTPTIKMLQPFIARHEEYGACIVVFVKAHVLLSLSVWMKIITWKAHIIAMLQPLAK